MKLAGLAASSLEIDARELRTGDTVMDPEFPAVRALKSAGGIVLRLPLPLSTESITDRSFVAAKKVDLTGVIVNSEILAKVNELPGLTELVLSGPEVDDDILRELRSCGTLDSLDLSGSNVTDEGLAYLASGAFPALRILTLNETAVTGEGLQELTQLHTLSVAHTNINDHDLERLAELKDLQLLNIVGTPITVEGLEAFRNAPGREMLVILGVPQAVPASTSGHIGQLPNDEPPSRGS